MARKKLSQVRSAISHYVEELERLGIHPERIILYGSYARGTAEPFSDVDIVVISRDLRRWPPIERLQMLSRATACIDAPLEVIGYTPQEIKKRGGKSIFWEEIMRTGREIYKRAA